MAKGKLNLISSPTGGKHNNAAYTRGQDRRGVTRTQPRSNNSGLRVVKLTSVAKPTALGEWARCKGRVTILTGIEPSVGYVPSTTVEMSNESSDGLARDMAEIDVWNPYYVDLAVNTYVFCVKHAQGWVIHSLLHWPPVVEFTLDGALTTSDGSGDANITTCHGLGQKLDGVAITVINPATNSAYMFSGANSARGIGMWSSGSSYLIVQMECP